MKCCALEHKTIFLVRASAQTRKSGAVCFQLTIRLFGVSHSLCAKSKSWYITLMSGHTVSELGYTIFGQPFLGSGDNAGFLYVKPSFQVGIKGLRINQVH